MEYFYKEGFSTISNLVAVLLGAWLSIKYFVRQQRILRLEKYFYADGIFGLEEILAEEVAKIERVSDFVSIKLDNLSNKISDDTISSNQLNKIISELETQIVELGSSTLSFNMTVIRTSEFINQATGSNFLMQWIRYHESNKKKFILEVYRLLQGMKENNGENSSAQTVSTLGKGVINLFQIPWQLITLTYSLGLVRKEILNGSISKTSDIHKIIKSNNLRGSLEGIEEIFHDQAMVCETKDALYPIGTAEHGIYIKKISVEVRGFLGSRPAFVMVDKEEKIDISNMEKRLFKYDELQSLATTCFRDNTCKIRVNFVEDYLNILSSKVAWKTTMSETQTN